MDKCVLKNYRAIEAVVPVGAVAGATIKAAQPDCIKGALRQWQTLTK